MAVAELVSESEWATLLSHWLSILYIHSTPPTTNQLQILSPALVRSLIKLPKCLMIKITQQSNGEQALSSLFFLQLSIIAPLRCYSILMKCRQLTNQLLWARAYYPAAYSWVVWGRVGWFLIKVAEKDDGKEGVLWRAGFAAPSPPPSSQPASRHPAVNNMHHSLDLCGCSWQWKVCVCVYIWVCEGLLQGALDKWRCHMVRPDVLVPYVHSSSKTTTGATIGPVLSSKASQPICFLPARPSALWVLAIFLVCSQFPTCFVSDEGKQVSVHRHHQQ